MIIPVTSNIIIKGLPVLDADWNEMDASIQTYRKGEVISFWDKVEIPLREWDVVYLNKANFFLILADNVYLVHSSAIFAIERPDEEL